MRCCDPATAGMRCSRTVPTSRRRVPRLRRADAPPLRCELRREPPAHRSRATSRRGHASKTPRGGGGGGGGAEILGHAQPLGNLGRVVAVRESRANGRLLRRARLASSGNRRLERRVQLRLMRARCAAVSAGLCAQDEHRRQTEWRQRRDAAPRRSDAGHAELAVLGGAGAAAATDVLARRASPTSSRVGGMRRRERVRRPSTAVVEEAEVRSVAASASGAAEVDGRLALAFGDLLYANTLVDGGAQRPDATPLCEGAKIVSCES